MTNSGEIPYAVRAFWQPLIQPWLEQGMTPFYLFSCVPVQAAHAELERAFTELPVRHWLSCKTQPLPALLRWWQAEGHGIEVVSELELRAALRVGFPPERILVNGPAKHHWLPRCARARLSVNFDSVAEVNALTPLARRLRWRCGVRILTGLEHDPQATRWPTQFGMAGTELGEAVRMLHSAGLEVQNVHFHLRTNVDSAGVYERALQDCAGACQALGLKPRFVDCGGGFPPRRVRTRKGGNLDSQFELAAMARVLRRAQRWFPAMEEFWMENGRRLSAESGVLVVRIMDAKERRGMRHVICDGGRTMNALVSLWELHDLMALPERRGARVMTTVTGPTCMAFDQLARCALPRGLREGDHMVWMQAGAYHLPWETRFSHGLASVLWHDGQHTSLVRRAEGFKDWWKQWRVETRDNPFPCP